MRRKATAENAENLEYFLSGNSTHSAGAFFSGAARTDAAARRRQTSRYVEMKYAVARSRIFGDVEEGEGSRADVVSAR
jgi:hypothetical protein